MHDFIASNNMPNLTFRTAALNDFVTHTNTCSTINCATYFVSGYIGNIYTFDVCSYLIRLSSPSWGIDTTVTDDPSHSHIKKTITSSLEVTCFCCEINLIPRHELVTMAM